MGQKNSTVAQIVEKLRQGALWNSTTVVDAGASELAPVQYIAPYAGCAMAEEWLDEGKDVLIVLMIYLSMPWLIVHYHYYLKDHQEEKLILEMFSTYIQDYWKELVV